MTEKRWKWKLLGASVAAWLGGCAAAPRAQLAASDAMDRLAASLRQAVVEYAGDIDAYDSQRQNDVVEAFVDRVRESAADESALAMHKAEFIAALRRIDHDREAARERQLAAIENIELLTEIAGGMRRLAIDSMHIDDEGRRYLSELAESVAAYKSSSREENK